MDFINLIHPYLKYILYLILIIGFLIINKIFVTNPELRKWIMQSFEENGRCSGKSLSAFLCTTAVMIGWFIAIHYGDRHTAPEYYFWGIIGLITSLYGIREVGKVMTTKYTSNGNGSGNGNGNGSNGHSNGGSDTPILMDSLKKKWKESGSELSFEEWIKTQNTIQ